MRLASGVVEASLRSGEDEADSRTSQDRMMKRE
jgi:hypothetical protein